MKETRLGLLAAAVAICISACGGGGGNLPAIPPAATAPSSSTPASPPAAPQAPNVAVTTEGPVAGIDNPDTIAFLGIPYAKPPVNELRWAPPQPPAAHEGLLKASAFGSACTQAPGAEATSSEDCLYLNVWKPANAKPGDRLPVIFYIHGGAFVLGSGAMGPSPLARHGVIVVSINYRLGAFGYLANRAIQMANRDGTLGNFAIMDQLAALGWVQRNIAAFGGDSGNVTLWGTSAGATQSFSLMQSPEAKGLFHRAVMQSGGGAEYSNPSIASSLAVGDTAVSNWGCAGAANPVVCLRALPASAVLGQGALKWRPTVDNRIITQVPARAFESGNFNQVPVMIGGVFDEGTLFVDPSLSAAYYPLYLRGLAPAGYDTTPIEAAYPIANYAVPAQGIARAMGDAMYACGNSARRDALSSWVPVYGWEFADPQLSFPPHPTSFYFGSAHGIDSYYWTGTVDDLSTYPYFDQRAAPADPTTTAQRHALSQQMVGYLINFATTGDPNGSAGGSKPNWPSFGGPADRALLDLTYPTINVTHNTFEQTHRCDTLWGPGVFPAMY